MYVLFALDEVALHRAPQPLRRYGGNHAAGIKGLVLEHVL